MLRIVTYCLFDTGNFIVSYIAEEYDLFTHYKTKNSVVSENCCVIGWKCGVGVVTAEFLLLFCSWTRRWVKMKTWEWEIMFLKDRAWMSCMEIICCNRWRNLHDKSAKAKWCLRDACDGLLTTFQDLHCSSLNVLGWSNFHFVLAALRKWTHFHCSCQVQH